MEVIFDGRIEDEFEGWDGDKVYELTNGSKWELCSYKYKYIYKYRPKARILGDGGSYYLEVEGLDEKVRVRRAD